MEQHGEALRSMLDLARLLENKVLIMLGDSMSFQVAESMRCAAAGLVGRAGLRPVQLRAQAPAEMIETCRFLMGEAGQERGRCGCRASADKAWRGASSCSLWSSLDDLLQSNGTFTATGVVVSRFNFTLAYDLDRVNKYTYVDRCYLCDAAHRDCAAPPPSGPHHRRGLLDHCAAHPLPSRVALAARLGADVLVGNWGLHVHSKVGYRTLLRAALRDLAAFARCPGKRAVFRETSAQHFAVPNGDYDDAVARDPRLVRAPTPATRTWRGPSLCTRRSAGAGAAARRLNASWGPLYGWRNRMLAEELAGLQPELAPAAGGSATAARAAAAAQGPRVRIQPYGALTTERWDMHESVVWQPERRAWSSDCSHFCYSPSFYSLVTHELYRTLASSYTR